MWSTDILTHIAIKICDLDKEQLTKFIRQSLSFFQQKLRHEEDLEFEVTLIVKLHELIPKNKIPMHFTDFSRMWIGLLILVSKYTTDTFRMTMLNYLVIFKNQVICNALNLDKKYDQIEEEYIKRLRKSRYFEPFHLDFPELKEKALLNLGIVVGIDLLKQLEIMVFNQLDYSISCNLQKFKEVLPDLFKTNEKSIEQLEDMFWRFSKLRGKQLEVDVFILFLDRWISEYSKVKVTTKQDNVEDQHTVSNVFHFWGMKLSKSSTELKTDCAPYRKDEIFEIIQIILTHYSNGSQDYFCKGYTIHSYQYGHEIKQLLSAIEQRAPNDLQELLFEIDALKIGDPQDVLYQIKVSLNQLYPDEIRFQYPSAILK